MKRHAPSPSKSVAPRIDDAPDAPDRESLVDVTARREDSADRGVDEGDGEASDGDIAAVAYALYEQRGATHGNDIDDWLEAERRVRKERARPDVGGGGPIG